MDGTNRTRDSVVNHALFGIRGWRARRIRAIE